MTRAVGLLLSLAALLSAVLALELLAGPGPDAGGDAPPVALPVAAAAASAADDDPAGLARTVLARPLFSPARRPAAAAGGGAGDTLPRLAGVVVAPGGGRAIFAPAAGRPLVVPEGGRIGRYVVRAIVPGQVTLSDAGRDLVIRPSLARGIMP